MCPQCLKELKRWNDLSKEKQDLIRRLPNRDSQTLDHRISNHLFCSNCDYEAHG